MVERGQEGNSRKGVLETLRSFSGSLLEAAKTRIELFSLELREETARVVVIIIMVSASIFLCAISLIMMPLAILFTFSQDRETFLLVLWFFTVVYTAGAVISSFCLWRLFAVAEMPFAETVRQIGKDARAMRTRQ